MLGTNGPRGPPARAASHLPAVGNAKAPGEQDRSAAFAMEGPSWSLQAHASREGAASSHGPLCTLADAFQTSEPGLTVHLAVELWVHR